MHKLSECVSDVMSWSSSNKLKLNQSKTEVLHITSQFRSSCSLPCLDAAGVEIVPSKVVRNLGVTVDNVLNMKQHIRNTCRTAAFGISRISKLRKYLDRQSTERLIHAFVTSHLDYCNGLYFGLPDSTISPLQRIQNMAARLITKTRKYEHITPILRSLHWLPILTRIQFKILLLVFKIKHGYAPSYLNDLLKPIVPSRSLRSTTHANFQYAPGPRTNTRYGDRTFAIAAPKLWNSLPIIIRQSPSVESFKASLKYFLFTGNSNL